MGIITLHPYQIAILILASFMIWQGGKKYLKHEGGQTFIKFCIRLIVWGGMAAIAVFPNVSNDVADFIGIEGNINAVILVGFILVFLMVFKLLSAIESLEQQISLLVREHALMDMKDNTKKSE